MSREQTKKEIRPYDSVADMVRALSENENDATDFEDHLNRRKVVHSLFAERSAAGVSQAEMAEKLNCSQSRISKLENGEDDDLRLGDLREYLAALDRDMTIVITEKSSSTVAQIKCHAFMIQALLEKLRNIAKGDDTLEEGVSEFHWEALFNMVRMIVHGAMELPAFNGSIPSVVNSVPASIVSCVEDQEADARTTETGSC